MVLIALLFLVSTQCISAGEILVTQYGDNKKQQENTPPSKALFTLKIVITKNPSAIENKFKDYNDPEVQREINQGFFDLIAANNVVGDKYPSDGRNLKEIKTYFKQYKSIIKKAIRLDYTYTPNSGGEHTFLSLACKTPHCSVEVVRFLCEKGANPNSRAAELYPGTCCLVALSSALDGNSEDTIKMQRDKFIRLKSAARLNGFGGGCLLLDKCDITDWFVAKNDEKTFLEGTEVVTKH